MQKIVIQQDAGAQAVKEKSIDELLGLKCIQLKMNEFHLNRTDLENNWIDFLQYATSNQECENCVGLSSCPKVTKGMKQDIQGSKEYLHFPLTPCQYGFEKFENQDILNRIALKNVGDKILLTRSKDLTMLNQKEGNSRIVLTQLGEYLKNPIEKGIYLYGLPGLGKSTLMGWLIRALVMEGRQCGYIHFPTFLMDIKAGFGDNKNDNQHIELMKNIDYLVIDDIGGENPTAWSRDEVLSAVLSYRSQNQKVTFFTSIYSIDNLKPIYSIKNGDGSKVERLIDRMKAVSKVIHLQGQDLR